MKNIMMKNLHILALIILLNVATFAASPSSLDFSFEADGRQITNFSVSTTGTNILVQPDGKSLLQAQ